jgi:hypothetical protein
MGSQYGIMEVEGGWIVTERRLDEDGCRITTPIDMNPMTLEQVLVERLKLNRRFWAKVRGA